MDSQEQKFLLDQIAELHGSMLLLRKDIPPLLPSPTLQLPRLDYLAAVVCEICVLAERFVNAGNLGDFEEARQLQKTINGFIKLVQGEIRSLVGLVIRRADYLGDELLELSQPVIALGLLIPRQAQLE